MRYKIYYVPREVKHTLAKKTPQLLKIEEMSLSKREAEQGAPDKVCQMHDTRL